jgi:hypothetical protein
VASVDEDAREPGPSRSPTPASSRRRSLPSRPG